MNTFSKMFCAMLFSISAASAYEGSQVSVESQEYKESQVSEESNFSNKEFQAYDDCQNSSKFQGYDDSQDGDQPQVFLAMDNGYRWDRISNRVTLGGPTASVRASTQLLKRINTYQFGGRGQWNFYDCVFVRGSGHYGWVWDAEYAEGSFTGHAKGHTFDVQAGIGYYYNLTPAIWVAPVIGWSHDALNITGTHIRTAINGKVYRLSDIKAHQQFSGPFVGFDLAIEINPCMFFNFGYEFHCARWRGQRLIQGPEYGNPPFGSSTGFSNVRHLERAYGQVFKLDGTYQFCDCWEVGIGLKYQFYNGDFGRYKQTRRPLLSQFTYANIDGLWWRSFAYTVFFGRPF